MRLCRFGGITSFQNFSSFHHNLVLVQHYNKKNLKMCDILEDYTDKITLAVHALSLASRTFNQPEVTSFSSDTRNKHTVTDDDYAQGD